jgi:hypothetical protein
VTEPRRTQTILEVGVLSVLGCLDNGVDVDSWSDIVGAFVGDKELGCATPNENEFVGQIAQQLYGAN